MASKIPDLLLNYDDFDDANAKTFTPSQVLEAYALAIHLAKTELDKAFLVDATQTAITYSSRSILKYLMMIAEDTDRKDAKQVTQYLMDKISSQVNKLKIKRKVLIGPDNRKLLLKYQTEVANELKRLIENKFDRGIREVSERTGITEAAISRIIHGTVTPRKSNLKAILEALNVEVVEISSQK